MTVQEVPIGYILRFFRGEELVAGLTGFCTERRVMAGWVNGLGALSDAEMGYYDLGAKAYRRTRFDELVELIGLVGNISEVDGEPFLHLHATVARPDLKAYGGHLFSATVGPTAEIGLFAFPGVTIARRPDEAIGLKLWELPPSEPNAA